MSQSQNQGDSQGQIKVGIEIHQQLDTSEKLFCSDPTRLREEEPDYSVARTLKATSSELGAIDRAALFESGRRRSFVYQGYKDTNCLVELDEEPPHDLNREGVKLSLMVSLILNMKAVDEIHVMRKLVIDGSNTSGFQRTAKVAHDGWLMDGEKRIGVQSLCLEEDAARKICEDGNFITYRLDRLGIPLIEIATAPDMHSGEQAERVALAIGRILRSTGKTKRGLGSIRQDLNVSVEGGRRVEVKGVQELGLISRVVQYEAMRQRSLIALKEELVKRGVTSRASTPPEDVTDVFASTQSKLIRKSLECEKPSKTEDDTDKVKVYAIVLPLFEGVLGRELQPGRRFGTELSDRAKVYGVGGIFHTDELPAYGITDAEVQMLRQRLAAKDGDCVVFIVAKPAACLGALEAVAERAYDALNGVPAEVRAANEDGTTRFMRPMPGSARMYPETDVPSLVVNTKMLEEVKAQLPEPLEVKAERYAKEFSLSRDLAQLIADSPYSGTFESLVKSDGLSASFVAATFEYTFKMLRREGLDLEALDPGNTREVFLKVRGGEVAKEAIPDILRWLAMNAGKGIVDALEALSLDTKGADLENVRAAVLGLVEKNLELVRRDGKRAVSPLMGDLMREFRGKVDGKILHEMLTEEINKRMANT